MKNLTKKKTQKEIRADFDALVALKSYAENQVRKVAGTGKTWELQAQDYLKNVEKELTETGAQIK